MFLKDSFVCAAALAALSFFASSPNQLFVSAQEPAVCVNNTQVLTTCLNENSVDQETRTECFSCLAAAQQISFLCFNQEINLCRAFDDCEACGNTGCIEDIRSLYVCQFREGNCPSFECPERICADQDMALGTCLGDNDVGDEQARSCLDCLTEAEQQADPFSCTSTLRNVCPAFDDCTDCTPCRDEWEDRLTCGYSELDTLDCPDTVECPPPCRMAEELCGNTREEGICCYPLTCQPTNDGRRCRMDTNYERNRLKESFEEKQLRQSRGN